MEHGWTLEQTDWDHLRDELRDRKWTRAILLPHHADAIPDAPGLYAICAGRPSGFEAVGPFRRLYNVLYVGIDGSSVRRRFREHCNRPKKELAKAKRCFGPNLDFWFTALAAEEFRSKEYIEGMMTRCLGPPANLVQGRGRITGTIGAPVPAGRGRLRARVATEGAERSRLVGREEVLSSAHRGVAGVLGTAVPAGSNES